MTTEPLSMLQKIWDRHRVVDREDGQTLLYVDRHLVHVMTDPPPPLRCCAAAA